GKLRGAPRPVDMRSRRLPRSAELTILSGGRFGMCPGGSGMPQTSISTYTDADSYAAALRGGQSDMRGKSSRPSTGKKTRTDFPRGSLKRDEVDVPWIVQFGGSTGRGVGFGFLDDVESAPMQINGTDVTSNDVWVIGPGPTVFASEGPTR